MFRGQLLIYDFALNSSSLRNFVFAFSGCIFRITEALLSLKRFSTELVKFGMLFRICWIYKKNLYIHFLIRKNILRSIFSNSLISTAYTFLDGLTTILNSFLLLTAWRQLEKVWSIKILHHLIFPEWGLPLQIFNADQMASHCLESCRSKTTNLGSSDIVSVQTCVPYNWTVMVRDW